MLGWLVGAVAAEDPTRSDRDPAKVDILAYPWSSIAKLNNSVGGSCTASAIEQDAVLTAAHCIFNRRTNRFLPPKSLHVLFGYERGHYAIHVVVDSYAIAPGYNPANELATMSSDWAVLRLDEPLPDAIKPLRLMDDPPTFASRLMLGSYAKGRRHVLTVDKDCKLVDQVLGSALVEHDCQVAQGSSGAPLLTLEGERAVIIGIQVASGRRGGAAINVAVSATSITKRLAP
jgi:protease YdgD